MRQHTSATYSEHSGSLHSQELAVPSLSVTLKEKDWVNAEIEIEREGLRHNEWIFIAHIFIRSHINEQTGRQKPAKMHVQSFACDVLTVLSRSLALQVMCMSVCFCVLFFSVLAHSDREILQEAGWDNVPWYKLYYVSLKHFSGNKKRKRTLKWMSVCCLRNDLPVDILPFFHFCWCSVLGSVEHTSSDNIFIFPRGELTEKRERGQTTYTHFCSEFHFGAFFWQEHGKLVKISFKMLNIYTYFYSLNRNITQADVHSILRHERERGRMLVDQLLWWNFCRKFIRRSKASHIHSIQFMFPAIFCTRNIIVCALHIFDGGFGFISNHPQ